MDWNAYSMRGGDLVVMMRATAPPPTPMSATLPPRAPRNPSQVETVHQVPSMAFFPPFVPAPTLMKTSIPFTISATMHDDARVSTDDWRGDKPLPLSHVWRTEACRGGEQTRASRDESSVNKISTSSRPIGVGHEEKDEIPSLSYQQLSEASIPRPVWPARQDSPQPQHHHVEDIVASVVHVHKLRPPPQGKRENVAQDLRMASSSSSSSVAPTRLGPATTTPQRERVAIQQSVPVSRIAKVPPHLQLSQPRPLHNDHSHENGSQREVTGAENILEKKHSSHFLKWAEQNIPQCTTTMNNGLESKSQLLPTVELTPPLHLEPLSTDYDVEDRQVNVEGEDEDPDEWSITVPASGTLSRSACTGIDLAEWFEAPSPASRYAFCEVMEELRAKTASRKVWIEEFSELLTLEKRLELIRFKEEEHRKRVLKSLQNRGAPMPPVAARVGCISAMPTFPKADTFQDPSPLAQNTPRDTLLRYFEQYGASLQTVGISSSKDVNDPPNPPSIHEEPPKSSPSQPSYVSPMFQRRRTHEMKLELDIVSKEQYIKDLEMEIALREKQIAETLKSHDEIMRFTQRMHRIRCEKKSTPKPYSEISCGEVLRFPELSFQLEYDLAGGIFPSVINGTPNSSFTTWNQDPYSNGDVQDSHPHWRSSENKLDGPSNGLTSMQEIQEYPFPVKRFVLRRDFVDDTARSNGVGLEVVGGQPCTDGHLGAFVKDVLPHTAASSLRGRIRPGDEIIAWNKVPLYGKSFEMVQEILRSVSTNELEVVIRDHEKEKPFRGREHGTCYQRSARQAQQPQDQYRHSRNGRTRKEDVPRISPGSSPSARTRRSHSERPVQQEGVVETLRVRPHEPPICKPHPSTCKLPRRRLESTNESMTLSSLPNEKPPPSPSRGLSEVTMTSTTVCSSSGVLAPTQESETTETEKTIPNIGEIEVSLAFDEFDQSLTVHIARGRNLQPMDMNGLADPFVKIRLHPDPTQDPDFNRETRYMENTLEPDWQQTMVFMNVLKRSLAKRILEFTVWDFDRLKTNDFMGQMLIHLGNRKVLDGRPYWYPLHEMREVTVPGQRQGTSRQRRGLSSKPTKGDRKSRLKEKLGGLWNAFH